MKRSMILIDPRTLRLKDGSDPVDFPFYDFLHSGAKMDKQIKETKYYKRYMERVENGISRVRRTGKIKNKKDVITCLKDLLNLNKVIQEDPYYKTTSHIKAFVDDSGHFRVFDGCHRVIC